MRINYFEKLLDSNMDRKEFLVYIGMILFACTGIASVLKNISHTNLPKSTSPSQGFGYSAYGGSKGGKV